MHAEVCRFLEWDSQFFGCRIARVNVDNLISESLADVLNWCRAERIDCLYWLVSAQDLAAPELALVGGFQLVDVRMTLDLTLDSAGVRSAAHPGIRPAQASDAPMLREIAAEVHTDTRFFADAHFPRDRAQSLYAAWIDRSLNEESGQVLVADDDAGVVGYIACQAGVAGSISIIGVRASAQGRGLGRALVQTGLNWFAARKLQRVTVVTQGRNIAAQRLYQRCGFAPAAVQFWYHRWFSAGPSRANS